MTTELREQFRMVIRNYQTSLLSSNTPTLPGGIVEEIALDEFELVLNQTTFKDICFMHDPTLATRKLRRDATR